MPEPLRQANCGVILLWVLQCPEDEVTGALSGGLSGNSPFPGHLPSSESFSPFSACDS